MAHRTLSLSTSDREAFLRPTDIVDHTHPEVRRVVTEVAGPALDPIERTRRSFEWVRDRIPHSFDSGDATVTCRASEVLAAHTGICHAKAHLLAAFLRALGIPAGFVYQVLCWDEQSDAKAVHGLNAVHLEPLGRWVLLDARGNTSAVDAQFDLERERLAFPEDTMRGESLHPTVFSEPAPSVVAALRAARDTEHLRTLLPTDFDR